VNEISPLNWQVPKDFSPTPFATSRIFDILCNHAATHEN
jgi:hypothetical protein